MSRYVLGACGCVCLCVCVCGWKSVSVRVGQKMIPPLETKKEAERKEERGLGGTVALIWALETSSQDRGRTKNDGRMMLILAIGWARNGLGRE